MHIYTNTHIHICKTYTHMHTHARLSPHTHTHTHAHTHNAITLIFMCIYMYLHTYTQFIHNTMHTHIYYKQTLSISRKKTLAECIQFSSHNILYNKIYSNNTYTTCIQRSHDTFFKYHNSKHLYTKVKMDILNNKMASHRRIHTEFVPT